MRDRLSEQKVQVRRIPGVILQLVWVWTCALHDCQAPTRSGRGILWAPVQFAADQHARQWHGHRHVGHDLY